MLQEKQAARFSSAVGNPPYQDNEAGANRNEPVWHHFVDLAASITDVSNLIHPLKFLVDGGNTPKEWNRRIREDLHYSVPAIWPDVNEVFPSAGPKEGVCVTMHTDVEHETSIESMLSTLLASPARDLARRVASFDLPSLADRMYSVTSYRLSETFYEEVKDADAVTPTASRRVLTSNIFERFSDVFREDRQAPDDIAVYGKRKGVIVRYLPARYISDHPNLHKWKVLVQMAGNTTLVVGPATCANQTFLTLGAFDTEEEARNAERYVNSSFARTIVSAVQLSQFGNRRVWRGVPDLQDYTLTNEVFSGDLELNVLSHFRLTKSD